MELTEAAEVFPKAISTIKSRYHPYSAELIQGLWVLRDGPGRREPRTSEVIATGTAPAEVVERIDRIQPGWHFLCDIRPPDVELGAIREEYKKLGYRAKSTEWMFCHDLRAIPSLDSDPPARLVTAEELTQIPQAVSQPRKLPRDARLFCVWDEKRDYGWVESVPVGENAWVSGLYVFESFRRTGYGGALMSALLQEDKRSGAKHSVLLASSAGAKLYPRLGYKLIGVLQSFCPVRS